jgi:hypothetical protein
MCFMRQMPRQVCRRSFTPSIQVLGLEHEAEVEYVSNILIQCIGRCSSRLSRYAYYHGASIISWQDDLSVCLPKPQVYIDLSGWSPKNFPPQLIRYANTLLKHKMLFCSDFLLITPARWLSDFEQIENRPEVRPLIL